MAKIATLFFLNGLSQEFFDNYLYIHMVIE